MVTSSEESPIPSILQTIVNPETPMMRKRKHEASASEASSFSSKFSNSAKYLTRTVLKNETFFGRTPASWGRLFIFYIIFYSVLVAFTMVFWWIFYQTINPRIPTHKTTESLIGNSPGLGFRPLPKSENVLSSLIWYKGTSNNSFQHWTDSLTEFLKVYKTPGMTPGRGENIFNCDYNRPPGPNQVCDMDVKLLAPCTQEKFYQYHLARPCIFLKLNKIYGWVPEFYNDTANLPSDMPNGLKERIYELANSSSQYERYKLNTVWVTCKGESPADAEHIGLLNFHPFEGFPGYFFPYRNTEGYLSPLVAVEFKRPRTGILINIECRAWAKNIVYKNRDKQGSVHFELMID